MRAIAKRRTAKEKGIIVLLTALMLLFTIPIVGLSIDASAVYMVKGKLQAASDAAALAAARNLNLGVTLSDQEVNARDRAIAYFHTNFPDYFMGSLNPTVTADFDQPQPSVLRVTVNTSVITPLYFMRILGANAQTINAQGQATRRNVNLILVLDQSGSMGATCDTMKSSAKSFVDYFAAERDQLGLLVFNSAFAMTYAPSTRFKDPSGGIKDAIDNISCGGGTGMAQALWNGYTTLRTIGQVSALNVLVLFTDGEPTALTADWPVKTVQDTRKGDGHTTGLTYNPADETASTTAAFSSTSTTYTFPPSSCRDAASMYYYRDTDPSPPTVNKFRVNPAQTVPYSPVAPNPNWMTTASPGASAITLTGVIQTFTSLASTNGNTLGISVRNDINEPFISTTGCSYNTWTDGNAWYGPRRDVAFIPAQDFYGNATRGYKDNYIQSSNNFVAGADNYPALHPYVNQMRIDQPSTFKNAAYNATDDAGRRIRTASGAGELAGVFINCIGLGGNGSVPVNTELLSRLANTADINDTYAADNTSAHRGIYKYAPNSSQLQQAFIEIASSVLRLSQ